LGNLPLLATVWVYLVCCWAWIGWGRRPRGMRRSSLVAPSRAAAGGHRLRGTQRDSPDQGGASLPHRILLFGVSFGGDCPAPATSSPEAKDPAMCLLPTKTRERIEAANSITEVVCPRERQADVPGLADWAWVPTPGHTGPRRLPACYDGVLLAGDAALTVDLNSVGGYCWASSGWPARCGTRPGTGRRGSGWSRCWRTWSQGFWRPATGDRLGLGQPRRCAPWPRVRCPPDTEAGSGQA
jgi:hypothetical protein